MRIEIGKMLPNITGTVPGEKSSYWASKLRKYEAAGLTPVAKNNVPIFWESAKGANVIDVDGNIYIDCSSGFGVAGVGHTNTRVVNSIKKQSDKLLHSMGDIFPHPLRAELVELISKKIGRQDQSQVILVNSGSEAVEVAIKTAIRYTGKSGVLSFQGAFHGQSIGALSVSSQRAFRDPFIDRVSLNTVFVPFPNPYRPIYNTCNCSLSQSHLNYIESLISDSVSGIMPIGAVIVEPIQGLHGYIIPPDDFLVGLRRLCDRYEILLIADEIFTGFGRSGAWLAVDHVQVIPDIITVGKIMTGGMPIAACVASSKIMTSWETSGFIALHGSTFMANPISCAAAIGAIQEIDELDLISQSVYKGEYLLERLKELKNKYQILGDVRGKGFLIGMEFVSDPDTKTPAPEIASYLANAALQKGVICIITGYPIGNVIALSPPLVITEQQLDFVIKVFDECLQNWIKINQQTT